MFYVTNGVVNTGAAIAQKIERMQARRNSTVLVQAHFLAEIAKGMFYAIQSSVLTFFLLSAHSYKS